MNKKRGFTLIELLAVIVILAVIALIATPIIMNVINDSKKGAAKDSAFGYIKAVELASTQKITATTDAPDGDYIIKDGNLYRFDKTTKVLDIYSKGTKPNSDGIISLDKGNVVSANFVIDGYQIHYNGKELSLGNQYLAGEVVYLNPETNQKCDGSQLNSADNAKSGCLKWNVVTTDDTETKTKIDVMLNHNTTSTIAWISKEDYVAAGGTEEQYGSTGKTDKGPITVENQLKSDVSTWNNTLKNTARLISAVEIAKIVGKDEWKDDDDSFSITDSSWLYQNLSAKNTKGQPQAYWTNTTKSSYDYVAWRVYFGKRLTGGSVYVYNASGVRPVITIAKTTIA